MRDEILSYLKHEWPTAVDLSPEILGFDQSQASVFVDTIQTLVDNGLIAIELLIVGVVGGPIARDVALTRKGLVESARL